jgi:hypothetical protein
LLGLPVFPNPLTQRRKGERTNFFFLLNLIASHRPAFLIWLGLFEGPSEEGERENKSDIEIVD